MNDIDVFVPARTAARTGLLGRIVGEILCRVAGRSGPRFLPYVTRGVVLRPYIATFLLRYLVADAIVGEVRLEIDHVRHRVHLGNCDKDLAVGPNENGEIAVQPGLVAFLRFCSRLASTKGVEIDLAWHWRPGIDLNEARRWMGPTELKRESWRRGRRSLVVGRDGRRARRDPVPGPDREGVALLEVGYVPGGLDELRVAGKVVLDAIESPQDRTGDSAS